MSFSDRTRTDLNAQTQISRSAILLLGPTGSGKTPLGEELQRRGLHGHACAHFDFGDHLRRIATGAWRPPTLTQDDVGVVTRAIEERALLTDDQFHIAEAILRAFITERGVDPETRIILNGMPRHAGQATAVDAIVRVRYVIQLDCPPEVVYARIETNAGGDRAGRNDDATDAIRRKLEIYAARTLPLVEHYRAHGTPVFTIPVNAQDTATTTFKRVERDIT